jgi:hypothetical protein
MRSACQVKVWLVESLDMAKKDAYAPPISSGVKPMRISKFVSSLCIALLIVPVANAQVRSRNDWTLVQRLKPRDKVAIQLKSGATVKGAFEESTETTLNVSAKTRTTVVDRNDVRNVYLVSGKSIGTYTLIGTGIGVAAGAVTGAAAGSASGCCFSKAAVFGVLLTAGTLIGTGIGFILGLSGHHGDLIYEAP